MTIWFTADLHFGHKGVIKHVPRPFASVEEMDQFMIKMWQRTVERGDEVYVLGDFSFHKAERTNQILRQLPGQKFLVKGNHDNRKVLKKIQGWAWVRDYYEMRRVKGELVILSHYPFHVWRNSHHGSWHLHGHSHGSSPQRGRRLDVGIDAIGWNALDGMSGLVSYEWVRACLENRPIDFGDYHFARQTDDEEETA